MKSRGTYAYIDLSKYKKNLQYFIHLAFPSKVMAVVKSDAYGHGAVMLSKTAVEAGIDFLAVAFLEEAIELRENGIDVPILVLNYFDPTLVSYFVDYNLTATLYSIEQLRQLENCIGEPWKLNLHLNVDTGMNRIGIRPERVMEILRYSTSKHFNITGIYTHFAVADEPSSEFTLKQIRLFGEVLETAHNRGYKFYPRHICNSAGILRFNEPTYDYVRLGISSYGLQSTESAFDKEVEPILSWKSIVSLVKTIEPGESVSYGRTFFSKSRMQVATIPVGYGDGYSRKLSNKGTVLIGGKRCKIIGRICMDQFMVDVSGLPKLPETGQEVILIGSQGEERITVEEIAKLVGTINYEITCNISKRVPRIYT